MDELPREHDEFELLFHRYRPMVYAIALRILRSPTDAEDVVQRVFLKMWAKPDAFRGGNVESWITTVAKNASFDHLRHAEREATVLGQPGSYSMMPVARSAEEEAVAHLLYDAVTNAMNCLDLPRRSLVSAAFVEQKTHVRIAAANALPIGTVKTRIRSGIAQLRRFFAEAS